MPLETENPSPVVKIKKFLYYLRVTYFERVQHDIKVALHRQHQPLVTFLGCGAQKAGTSALDRYLRQHPDICLPDRKEIHFFDIEYNFRYPLVNYAKYHSFFDFQSQDKIAGEVTPSYMYWTYSPRRIWEYNPEMKLIILLRNPIERAYSHWNMNRSNHIEPYSFHQAIQLENQRKRACLPYQDKEFSYLERGLYSIQIRRLGNFFPTQQMLLLRSSDLDQNPIPTMNKVFLFLDLPVIDIQEEEPVHQGTYEQDLAESDKAYLKEYFQPDIKALEQLLDWDCSDWLA